MKKNDWSKFTKRVNIKAKRKKIEKLLTSPKGLETWFLRQAKFIKSDGKVRASKTGIKKGDKYEWLWHGYPDTLTQTGTILECNGKDFIKFTFTMDTVVSMKVSKEGKENMLVLEQTNIPADDNPKTNLYIGCGEGWVFYLTNLKSILEGGIDLRNKDEKIKGVITA